MKRIENCPLCSSTALTSTVNSDLFDIIHCESCLNYFTSPSPIVPEYENMDFHANGDSANFEKLKSVADLPEDWRRLIKFQIEIIKQNLQKDANVLEIGCGEGLLLNELSEIGYFNIEGVEPSKTAYLRAKRKQIKVYNDYLENLSLSNKYDVIILSHVLEHVKDPISFVAKLAGYLKPNGHLLLTQTNCEGLIPRKLKANWYAWVPEQHFWHFTEKGIQNVLGKSKFKVKKVKYTSLVHDHNWLYWAARVFYRSQDQFIILLQHQAKS